MFINFVDHPPWAPSAPSAGPNITRTNSVICYSSCDFCSYCHGLALHGGSWVLWIWIFEGSRRWVFSATPLAPLQLGQLSDVVVANFMWIRDCPWFCAFFLKKTLRTRSCSEPDIGVFFFDSEPQRLRYHLRRQMPGGREFTRHDLGDPPSRSVVSRW